MNIQHSYRSWLSFTREALFIFLLNCIIIINGLQAQTYTFAQINGSPANTTGWNLQGQAGVGNILFTDNSEIILCPAVGGSNGAVFFNQPINFSICNKWVAEFDFRMFDGSGADGMAFCFLDVPPSGFVSGAGIGIPASANGLKVCFDQFPNCTGDLSEMPKIELRWGIGYDECWSQPTLSNSGGSLDFIRSAVYNRARIVYDAGSIEVFVNDSLYLTGFQTFNFTGYVGFTSSTGAFTDNHSIRNVVIYTETATIQPNTIVYSDSCLGNATRFSIQDTSGISSISWNFADPVSGASNTATGFNVNHTFSQIGNYNVRAILTNACGIDSLFKTLTIVKCDSTTEICNLAIPNAFSPNGDWINDKFYPLTICPFEHFEFSIFNRWGELIFKTTNQTDKWDGKYKGSDCSSGVYVYKITYKFPSQQKKIAFGSITLLR